MSGIAAFLNARLDEDEQTARYATTRDVVDSRSPGGWGGWWYGHQVHYSRYSPERISAEVASKRRALMCAAEQPAVFDEMVRHMAEVYSEHPDYNQEWRA